MCDVCVPYVTSSPLALESECALSQYPHEGQGLCVDCGDMH